MFLSSSRLLTWYWETCAEGEVTPGSTRWAAVQPILVAPAALIAESSVTDVSRSTNRLSEM
jgi:hypothetical protein